MVPGHVQGVGMFESEEPNITALRDDVWLWLCVMSLVVYLLRSEAVTAFLKEAWRLLGTL
jgi:hypothetical protein